MVGIKAVFEATIIYHLVGVVMVVRPVRCTITAVSARMCTSCSVNPTHPVMRGSVPDIIPQVGVPIPAGVAITFPIESAGEGKSGTTTVTLAEPIVPFKADNYQRSEPFSNEVGSCGFVGWGGGSVAPVFHVVGVAEAVALEGFGASAHLAGGSGSAGVADFLITGGFYLQLPSAVFAVHVRGAVVENAQVVNVAHPL